MLATHYHKDIEVRRLGLDQWPRQELSYLPDAEYGRRPYPNGRKFCQLLLGEFASFDWFLEALLFLVFFWTPYLLRGFLFKRFPFVSLLCGVAHPLGPSPFGLNFWGHPSSQPSGSVHFPCLSYLCFSSVFSAFACNACRSAEDSGFSCPWHGGG